MLTIANFTKHEPVVTEAVVELFDHCIGHEHRTNDFLVFLENGHYDDSFMSKGFNPFLIGQGMEGLKDRDRLAFVKTYTQIPFEEHYNKAQNDQEKFDARINSTAVNLQIKVDHSR